MLEDGSLMLVAFLEGKAGLMIASTHDIYSISIWGIDYATLKGAAIAHALRASRSVGAAYKPLWLALMAMDAYFARALEQVVVERCAARLMLAAVLSLTALFSYIFVVMRALAAESFRDRGDRH
jgi:hypothetical protein